MLAKRGPNETRKSTKNSNRDNMTTALLKILDTRNNTRIMLTTNMIRRMITASNSRGLDSKQLAKADINNNSHTTPNNTINMVRITESKTEISSMSSTLMISVNLQIAKHFILSSSSTNNNNSSSSSGISNHSTRSRMFISRWILKSTILRHSSTKHKITINSKTISIKWTRIQHHTTSISTETLLSWIT